jgi:hypothetical protein
MIIDRPARRWLRWTTVGIRAGLMVPGSTAGEMPPDNRIAPGSALEAELCRRGILSEEVEGERWPRRILRLPVSWLGAI